MGEPVDVEEEANEVVDLIKQEAVPEPSEEYQAKQGKLKQRELEKAMNNRQETYESRLRTGEMIYGKEAFREALRAYLPPSHKSKPKAKPRDPWRTRMRIASQVQTRAF